MTDTNETLRWGWWVVRDDGDPMEGPYDTQQQADERLHLMYDRGEYGIERRYTAAKSPERPASSDPAAVAELEAALAEARRRSASTPDPFAPLSEEEIAAMRPAVERAIAGERVDESRHEPEEALAAIRCNIARVRRDLARMGVSTTALTDDELTDLALQQGRLIEHAGVSDEDAVAALVRGVQFVTERRSET